MISPIFGYLGIALIIGFSFGIAGALLNYIMEKKSLKSCPYCGSSSLFLQGLPVENEPYVECYLFCSDCDMALFEDAPKHVIKNRQQNKIV